jgi:DNA-binding NarL/FixJ family response regulator
MISILIVDDQAVVRDGLRSMLRIEPDMSVIGEAADGQEAVELASALHPDVILLDVRMPGMDGLTTLPQLKARCPRSSVIMVTLYDDPDYLVAAVSAGAAGYVLKDATREELVRAVRITADGGAIIAPSMLPQLLRTMGRVMGSLDGTPTCSPVNVLSGREMEVLRLVAEGCTNQEIAARLILSPTTIKTHVQNILQKLEVSDRTQAAVLAVRCGLI